MDLPRRDRHARATMQMYVHLAMLDIILIAQGEITIRCAKQTRARVAMDLPRRDRHARAAMQMYVHLAMLDTK